MQSDPARNALLLCTVLLLLAACTPAPDAAKVNTAQRVETSSPVVRPLPGVSNTNSAMNDPLVIRYEGFGPATFGANEEAVRMAWGRPMKVTQPQEGASCYYLYPEMGPGAERGIGFMFEGGKFVRYDVQDASQIAPGNFKVGDAAIDIKSAFAGSVEEASHKYIAKGSTLTVTPDDRSEGRLIFEIGEDGTVLNWRVGVPPQVFYVEGCS